MVGEIPIAYIGQEIDLTYPADFLGSQASLLKEIAEGQHPFCKNLKDLSEITDTANEVIQDEVEDSEEGEVLFGSADVIVNDLTILMLQYTNSQLPKKEIDEIIDLLTEQEGELHLWK